MSNPDRYYLEQITTLGEWVEIIASEDIRSSMGVKLLKEGARIDRGVLHRLLEHKLLRPIDYSVLVAEALDREALIAEAISLVAADQALSSALNGTQAETFVRRCFARTVLSIAMQNKLTVAYRQRPELFAHSLRVALTARLIGEQLRLERGELEVLSLAGLFHDIGELQADPALFGPASGAITEQQRCAAHPLAGYRIVKETQNYPPLVSRAVIEHHERPDGSGYPKGLRSHEICRPAKILLLADVATSLTSENTFRAVHSTMERSTNSFDRDAADVCTTLMGIAGQVQQADILCSQ